jgi:hypothetical protein
MVKQIMVLIRATTCDGENNDGDDGKEGDQYL